MAPRTGTATVLGHEVGYSVRPGTAGLPPLVICNGIGASRDLLIPFVDAVDPRLEVVTFDVPGVGGSPAPVLPYRFPLLAWGLARLIRELGYEEFDVLGVSWGGALAQQIALQCPRRCRRVILASTATGTVMVPAGPGVLSKMATPRRYRDPAYATAIAAQVYGGRLRNEPDLVRTLLHPHARAGSRRGYLYQLLAGLGWTSLPWLPLVRQRTLVLTGSDDPIIPEVNGRLMSALLPHASLHVFEDGHLGLVTAAGELAPLVSQFLLTPPRRPS